jgi:hypothetical protein
MKLTFPEACEGVLFHKTIYETRSNYKFYEFHSR